MRVLCVGAHPDDIELGCGGTVSRLKADVFGYVATRNSTRFVKLGMCGELREAWKILGIREVEASQDHKGRDLNRQKILDDLIQLRSTIKPDIVFTHGLNDVHQDHRVIHQESVRAFKHSTIIGYTFPWNELSNNYSCFYELKQKDVDNKLRALECYRTQKHRVYFDRSYQEGLMKLNGVRINKQYAEGFEVIRLIQ